MIPHDEPTPNTPPTSDAAPGPAPTAPLAPADQADPGTIPPQPTGPPSTTARIKRTRISATWVAVIIAVVVLIFLLIFILQNLTTATVHYLGISGTVPLGVALLFAAVGGAVLVALVGTARMLQLRKVAGKARTSYHERA
jgi:uncharacterized integral membrane protein